MNQFEYERPSTLAEAVAAGSAPGAAYLAAGTNLLDLMKGGVMRPGRLVDIGRIAGLDRIEPLDGGGVRIGALVRNSDLAYDTAFARDYPAVAEALLSGASAQLRNAATVGGNLLQRTRCAYFYDTASACNKRSPGAGCDALEGENRLHAVLGWSDRCIATNPSDFCVPLAALDAVVEVHGAAGRRDIPIDAFHLLPGTTPERETALEPGELIAAVRLPAEAAGFARNARYLKVRERTSYAFAVVSAAAALRMDGGAIAEARLALGGVALKPWRAPRGGGGAGRRPTKPRRLPRRGRGGAGRRDAVRRQRVQDRAGAPHRRPRAHARRRRHTRPHAGAPRLPVCNSVRSRSCLISRSLNRPRMSAWAPASASP